MKLIYKFNSLHMRIKGIKASYSGLYYRIMGDVIVRKKDKKIVDIRSYQ